MLSLSGFGFQGDGGLIELSLEVFLPLQCFESVWKDRLKCSLRKNGNVENTMKIQECFWKHKSEHREKEENGWLAPLGNSALLFENLSSCLLRENSFVFIHLLFCLSASTD